MKEIIIANRHNYKGKGVYIGRGTIWGNKSSHKQYRGVEVLVKTRRDSIKWYWRDCRKRWVSDKKFREELLNLVQKVKRGEKLILICSCAPKLCHGHVLARIICRLIQKGY